MHGRFRSETARIVPSYRTGGAKLLHKQTAPGGVIIEFLLPR